MSLLQDRATALTRKFQSLSDWEARYKLLIEWGRELPAFPEELRTEENKVRGCQSQVWLHASLDEEGRMWLRADSDALIVKGLIATLLQVYSGVTPGDILQFPPEFLKTLGFEGHLSPSRANGLHAMLKQIRHYAVAFDYLWKSKKTH
ncbi:MAG: SufE family protein [Bdellovibrionaceae bacterium]|nr:SufE family protein [Pseudobdellovibrionaceae bacterium]MBX3034280.1 SufE family protein [Pseudobdellovibrionaceae bacterium]